MDNGPIAEEGKLLSSIIPQNIDSILESNFLTSENQNKTTSFQEKKNVRGATL